MKRCLSVATKAARSAGAVIVRHYRKLKSSDIHKKGKHDLVTKADFEANRVIIKTIKQYFPRHDFLSEETGFENNPDVYTWVVDPLDGTTNYAIGDPLFCTALALVHKRDILLSVIYAPLLKEFFVAVRGRGALLNGKKIRVSLLRKLENAVIVVGRSHRRSSHYSAEGIQKKLERRAMNTRRLGSDSMDLAYVASGRVDGCLLVPPHISAWDSAPGVLLVREAGGRVSDFGGTEWHLGSSGVVASGGFIHRQLLKVVPP